MEIETRERNFPSFEIISNQGVEEMDVNLKDMLPNIFGQRTKKRKMKVNEAFKYLIQEEEQRLIDMEQVTRTAIDRVENSGIIFLDEIDKIAGRGSFALNADRSLGAQLPAFRPMVAKTVWERSGKSWRCVEGPRAVVEEGDEADYAACVLGLREYVDDNRFPGVVLGLSGGVNSALCAAMAVDALGAERVQAVMLPYRFTSNESLADAAGCAKALGIRYDIVPIAEPVEGVEHALTRMFAGKPRDITEENIQSRARGLILMAISNKTGAMVVTTGNKSEMSVGYATLYGDMNGGFNPIKDLYKMEVFRLSALRNRWKPAGALGPDGEVIPENIIVKPPSAELRENQKDEDSLPPYPVLDGILHGLVEKEMRIADIIAEGYDPATVRRVERLLYLAEYKRRQSAPGVKVGPKNFGRDRRYPIVNRFRDLGLPAQKPDPSLAPAKSIGTSERFEE